MRQLSVTVVSEYLALLRGSVDEVYTLRTQLLANGTAFFRDQQVWDFIVHDVLPGLMARARPLRPLRVWVPHCGAGAEAYSLAMLLLEHASVAQRGAVPVQLFASDADGRAIEVARTGRVPWIASTAIGPARLRRFFVETLDGYQVRPELRRAVSFARHDLLSDLPFLHMDLICCRYFLTYLRRESRLAVATLLQQSLDDDGYLVLGRAERLGELGTAFEQVSRRWSVYRRIGRTRSTPGVAVARGEIAGADAAACAAVLHAAAAPAAMEKTHQGDLARMLRLVSLGKLAASLAHELSQPLSAVANILDACATHLRTGGATTDELLDLTHQASSQSHRAGRIIAHIRRLLHDGERRVERRELRTLVRTAAELMRSTFLEQGIELQLALGDVPLWGDLCRIEIEQVVLNLLQNATDAIIQGARDRRRVRVEASKTADGHATVTVADNGSGIPADVAGRLFGPFFTTKPDGFGMGLAICRSIVEAHGGQLWIDRSPDAHATRVCFSLPLARRARTVPSDA